MPILPFDTEARVRVAKEPAEQRWLWQASWLGKLRSGPKPSDVPGYELLALRSVRRARTGRVGSA